MAKARLEEMYQTKIRSELQASLGLNNTMQVPKIVKIVLNVGVKEAVADSKALDHVIAVLSKIAGQASVKTIAKKSIAGFKIREGMTIGTRVTLRRQRMYEFLDRLINLALPRVKDFQGVTTKFDRNGGYNLGIKEWAIFPEADDINGKVHGLNVTIHIAAAQGDHSYALLQAFGMPFKKELKKS